MFKRIYDFFSVIRQLENLFNLVKFLASPFEPIVMAFLNWRLRPDRPLVLKRGSTLQMVILPDERAYVGWPVVRAIVKPFVRSSKDLEEENEKKSPGVPVANLIMAIPVIALLALAMFVVLVNANPFIRDILLPRNLPDITLETIPVGQITLICLLSIIFLVMLFLILWFARLIAIYWWYEWARRHKVLAHLWEGVLHLEADPIFRLITPFYSGENKKIDTITPPEEITEIELATDAESLYGGEKTSEWQDRWSQYISKKYQVQAIRMASRSRADDIFPAVTYAPTTIAVLSEIVDRGRTYKDTLKTFREREQVALSEKAGSAQYDAKKSAREAERVWEDFDKIYPPAIGSDGKPIKMYQNAFALDDPGLWNRQTVERIKPLQRSSGDSPPDFNLGQSPSNPPANPNNLEASTEVTQVAKMQAKPVVNQRLQDDNLFPLRIDKRRREATSSKEQIPPTTSIEEKPETEESGPSPWDFAVVEADHTHVSQEFPADFEWGWRKKQEGLTEAGFSKEEAFELYDKYNLPPLELSFLVILKRMTKNDILREYPI